MDPESIAAGIDEALNNQIELRAAGLSQAQKFSWDRTAEQTLAILKSTSL
jgi:glycosyltransferase involved in cell wall biosynthesis